ncbi:MAG TPA: hypothetical protein VGK67_17300 [Myxococcales bacterium]|jgi:hypothetical protein
MNLGLLAALLFLQSPAPQPACQVGQVIVDDEGHCCWPGQSWKRRGCQGKPHCPPGMVATHHACAPPAPMGYPATPSQAPTGYPTVPSQAPSPTFAGVPTMPSPYAVPVRFTASKPEDSYEVEVLTGGMPVCKTPCELRLVPNRYQLRVRGSARFSDKLLVLNQPMDLKVEHASGGWKALGTASVIVGAVAFAGGLTASGLVFLSAESNRDPVGRPFPSDPSWARKRNEKLLVCGGVSLVGAALAITGGVIGFKRAGHTGFTQARAPAAPAPAATPAPDTDTPAAAPVQPTSTRHDEPAFELLAIGAAPTENGVAVGAVFSF